MLLTSEHQGDKLENFQSQICTTEWDPKFKDLKHKILV